VFTNVFDSPRRITGYQSAEIKQLMADTVLTAPLTS
jgi:hypothetical protein